MTTFSSAYQAHIEAHGFCPLEAGSVGFQGQPLIPRRMSLHALLADFECPACGALPRDLCGCAR